MEEWLLCLVALGVDISRRIEVRVYLYILNRFDSMNVDKCAVGRWSWESQIDALTTLLGATENGCVSTPVR